MREYLLRDICETPEDDLPRLVYCDWLEENGEVELAIFIRKALKSREITRFAKGIGHRIYYPLASTHTDVVEAIPNVSFTTRRGFMLGVECRAIDFNPEWFRIHPIQEVRLRGDAISTIRIVSEVLVDYARQEVGLSCISKSNKKAQNTESPKERQMVNSWSSAVSLLQDVPLSPLE